MYSEWERGCSWIFHCRVLEKLGAWEHPGVTSFKILCQYPSFVKMLLQNILLVEEVLWLDRETFTNDRHAMSSELGWWLPSSSHQQEVASWRHVFARAILVVIIGSRPRYVALVAHHMAQIYGLRGGRLRSCYRVELLLLCLAASRTVLERAWAVSRVGLKHR